jgi:hypothetical protein
LRVDLGYIHPEGTRYRGSALTSEEARVPGNEARKALRRREVSDKDCGYPTCGGKALVDEEGDVTDCCYKHSLGNSDTDNNLPNDGIIDQTAIEVAVKGLRPVKLTWVEKDIALGRILAAGGTLADGERNLGVNVYGVRQRNSRRVKSALQIAGYLIAQGAPLGD